MPGVPNKPPVNAGFITNKSSVAINELVPVLNTTTLGAPPGPASAIGQIIPLASSATPTLMVPVKPANGIAAIPRVFESSITPNPPFEVPTIMSAVVPLLRQPEAILRPPTEVTLLKAKKLSTTVGALPLPSVSNDLILYPPLLAGAVITSSTPSPFLSPAATLTPPVNAGEQAKKSLSVEVVTAPVALPAYT